MSDLDDYGFDTAKLANHAVIAALAAQRKSEDRRVVILSIVAAVAVFLLWLFTSY